MPRIDPADPAAVWSALLASLRKSNAAAWLDLFTLQHLDTNHQPAHASIAPQPDAAHARRFATAPRLERLGQLLGNLVGQPVRVTVADAPAPNPLGHSPDTDNTQANKNSVDRRAALDLPLVRDALNIFPQAILLDARPEPPPPEVSPPEVPKISPPESPAPNTPNV